MSKPAYKVVSVRSRAADEAKVDERIDVSRCHPAEREKVAKIAKAYFAFGGYRSELKATATDGKGHTILSIMPWKEDFSAPKLTNEFHRKRNDASKSEYDSILDTRIAPLTGEVRVLIQKTAQTALAEDRRVQPPPNALSRMSAQRLAEDDQSYGEGEPSAYEGEEEEEEAPVDVRHYSGVRPYIPKRR